jgi:aspartate aminotransferase
MLGFEIDSRVWHWCSGLKLALGTEVASSEIQEKYNTSNRRRSKFSKLYKVTNITHNVFHLVLGLFAVFAFSLNRVKQHAVTRQDASMGIPQQLHLPSTSFFSSLPTVEPDEVFALLGAFFTDTHPDRVNLGAGIYCSDEGKPWPLGVVSRVEKSMHEQQDIRRHDYLPIEGDQRFLRVARDLVFAPSTTIGISSPHLPSPSSESRVVSVQTLSGTGANHIGARFVAETIRPRCVWLSNPTWPNHHDIWNAVGIDQRTYPYYDAARNALDFTTMITVLERESQPRDVLVLHACAHNPTGVDPTQEQWMAIADLCQRKELFPFFDNAYQGFASGDPARDAWAIRYFCQLQPPLEICVAQSFSKNFGLYGQRVGALHLVVNDSSKLAKARVRGKLLQLIRSEYSVSPRYGSDIVREILESESLLRDWLADLRSIISRIKSMRRALYEELCHLRTPGSWRHIIEQVSSYVPKC